MGQSKVSGVLLAIIHPIEKSILLGYHRQLKRIMPIGEHRRKKESILSNIIRGVHEELPGSNLDLLNTEVDKPQGKVFRPFEKTMIKTNNGLESTYSYILELVINKKIKTNGEFDGCGWVKKKDLLDPSSKLIFTIGNSSKIDSKIDKSARRWSLKAINKYNSFKRIEKLRLNNNLRLRIDGL